ncbi:MAG: SAM-dependent methyltransferase [Chloroflexi bacterium]|nr:SAM-dependent methyltransferase [Chloroflexota bacterium]
MFRSTSEGSSGAILEAITDRIQKQGKITFAAFMEMALFHPTGGYYTSPSRVGAEGDYYTSPCAHPVFGALLAIQAEQLWEILRKPNPFFVVEPGAGSGLMARDFLRYSQNLAPSFQQSLRYLALDMASAPVNKASFPNLAQITSKTIPLKDIEGCVLSNELVDCSPVHRFEIRDGRIQEIYVTLQDGQLDEVLGEPSTPLIAERLGSLGVRLTEGYRSEVNLYLASWMKEVSQSLTKGFVITIDYGTEAQDLYSPARSRGTMRSYYKHTEASSPYAHLGEQDMTAHVDFTSLIEEGKKNGLEPLGFVTQREFLMNLGFGSFLKSLKIGRPQLAARDYYAHQMAMMELIKPEGLGSFRVLIQAKGVGQPSLYGLTPGNNKAKELEAKGEELALPPLTPQHTPLMAGRYPHMLWDWGGIGMGETQR